MAIVQLMMCGSCNSGESSDGMYSFDTSVDMGIVAVQISWLLFGLLIVGGYATPALLYRAAVVPDVALYFAWAGGTVILASMIIYLRLIWNRK
jgi:Vacuolar protein sorting 55